MMFQEANKKQYTQTVSINITSETSIDLSYHCFTYINYFTIWKLPAVTEGVTILNSETACDLCSMMKAIQKVLCRSITRAKKLLELIYTNLVSPVATTLIDEHYYILFKDNYSSVVKMYSLKSKDQIYNKYVKYKTLVENHLKLTIKHLWTNNDTEYDNDQFITALKTSDIQWEPSASYMQVQNSKTEQLHHTIINMIKAVLIAQKLLKLLWIKFVKACCYIWNWVLEVDLQTFYKCFKGSQPDLLHLQVLECKVFVIISPEYCHNKLSIQSWEGILIDYNGVNSYWVYNPLIKRVKIYCDVEFHKYETTHNINTSNKFQYTEFDKYKESETVEIDIPESINQNVFTESSIEPFIKVEDIDFSDTSQNVLPELTNISITPHCSECNQQSTHY